MTEHPTNLAAGDILEQRALAAITDTPMSTSEAALVVIEESPSARVAGVYASAKAAETARKRFLRKSPTASAFIVQRSHKGYTLDGDLPRISQRRR